MVSTNGKNNIIEMRSVLCRNSGMAHKMLDGEKAFVTQAPSLALRKTKTEKYHISFRRGFYYKLFDEVTFTDEFHQFIPLPLGWFIFFFWLTFSIRHFDLLVWINCVRVGFGNVGFGNQERRQECILFCSHYIFL